MKLSLFPGRDIIRTYVTDIRMEPDEGPSEQAREILSFEVGIPQKPFAGIRLQLPESGIPLNKWYITAGKVPFALRGVLGALDILAVFPGEALPPLGDTPLGEVTWEFRGIEKEDGGDDKEEQTEAHITARQTPLQIALRFHLGSAEDLAFLKEHLLMLRIGERIYYMDTLEEGDWSYGLLQLSRGNPVDSYSMNTTTQSGRRRRISLPFDVAQLGQIEACFIPLTDDMKAMGMNSTSM